MPEPIAPLDQPFPHPVAGGLPTKGRPRARLRAVASTAARGPLLTAVLLAVMLIGLARSLVFQGRALTGIDIQLIFWPYRQYLGEALARFRIPLWNPYAAMGTPFAANPLARVFYPVDWLFVPLAADRALVASAMLHLFIGGMGMWYFAARVLALGNSGRLLSAVTFALSGVMMARVAQPNFLVAVAWMPAVFAAASLAAGRRGLRPVLALAVLLSLQFLGGHPQYTWMTLLALLPWMLFEAVRTAGARAGRDSRRPGNAAGGLAKSAAWGIWAWLVGAGLLVALCAVQLIPAIRLWWLAARRGAFEEETLFAHSLSNETAAAGLFPLFQTIPPSAEVVGFVGFAATALALVALVAAHRRGVVWLLVALTGVAILLAYGNNTAPGEWIYQRVPSFGAFRATARWLAVSTFALAALAGIGLDAIARPASPRKRRLTACVALLLFALAGWLVYGVLDRQVGLFRETKAIWAGAGLGAAALTSLAILLRGRWYLLLPAAAAVELAFAALPYDLNSGIPREAFASPNALATALAADGFDGRLLSVADVEAKPLLLDPARMAQAETLYRDQLGSRVFHRYGDALANSEAAIPNLPLAYGLRSADLYDGGLGITKQFVQFQSALFQNAGEHVDYTLRMKLGAVPDPKVLDLLNVRYLVEDTTYDGVVDDVYVDLDLDLTLRPGDSPVRINLREPYQAVSAVGFSFLRGAAALVDGAPAARLTLLAADGREVSFAIRAGNETAEGDYDALQGGPKPRHRLPGYTRRWRGNIRGYDSAYSFDLPKSFPVQAIEFEATGGAPEFHLRGLTLRGAAGSTLPVPVRAGGQLQLLDGGSLRLVAQESLKVYRNDPVLPRAYLVRGVLLAPHAEGAISIMRSPEFQWRRQVILQRDGPPLTGLKGAVRRLGEILAVLPPRHGYGALDERQVAAIAAASTAVNDFRYSLGSGEPGGDVEVKEDRPERVVLRAVAAEPAVLVLADSIYPGWNARLDGAEVPVMRANHNYRGVLLPAGEHSLEFYFDPDDFRNGWIVSLVAAVVMLAAAALPRRRGDN